MTGITRDPDRYHVLNGFPAVTLVVKISSMTRKKQGAITPAETPPVLPQPEVKPPAEPAMPVIPMEDPHVQPSERPGEMSPYDLPPPGDGLFPEIFE